MTGRKKVSKASAPRSKVPARPAPVQDPEMEPANVLLPPGPERMHVARIMLRIAVRVLPSLLQATKTPAEVPCRLMYLEAGNHMMLNEEWPDIPTALWIAGEYARRGVIPKGTAWRATYSWGGDSYLTLVEAEALVSLQDRRAAGDNTSRMEDLLPQPDGLTPVDRKFGWSDMVPPSRAMERHIRHETHVERIRSLVDRHGLDEIMRISDHVAHMPQVMWPSHSIPGGNLISYPESSVFRVSSSPRQGAGAEAQMRVYNEIIRQYSPTPPLSDSVDSVEPVEDIEEDLEDEDYEDWDDEVNEEDDV